MTEKTSGARTPDQEPETDDPLQRFLARIKAFAIARQKQLTVAAAIVCVAVIAGAGVFYFLERARENASEMLIQTTRQYQQLGENPSEEEIERIRQNFEKLIEEYGYTGPAKVALLQYAGLCYRNGDYGRALELYEKAYEAFEDSFEFRSLALNGMAHAHAAMGEYEKALSFFEQVAGDQNQALRDQALFNLGLLYSRIGDSVKSRKAYEKLVNEFPGSIFAEPARDMLSG
ncbi:MAG: tetratricopeptide repeat protein [Desulfobacteraceae bacterium]|nr:tetratricopeptide repeat protein [Desulfobacteraceae bacterium]